MNLNIKSISILLLFFLTPLYAQTFTVEGTVFDALTGQPLSYANIRIDNSTRGAAANADGEYSLQLPPGSYKLIASYLGYNSDTLNIKLVYNLNLQFALEPSAIEYSEITVLPGVNPAIALMQKAIERKNERNRSLNSYIFTAYTKGIIKTTEDITTGDNRVGVGLGGDSLKITGIIENESRGYFKKPDLYKEEIIARKQTANVPSTLNILTGGRIIQDFYSDDIHFFNRELMSPVADKAIDFYDYRIEDTLAIDNKTVFKVYLTPLDKDNPGFFGHIFVMDKTYDLAKVDLYLTPAANPGQIFTTINVFQQFFPFAGSIYMPVDYRLFVEGNYIGLLKFGLALNSIMYNYDINPDIPNSFFDMVLLKVQPDADEKDSTYWKNTQSIPSTTEETSAYNRIDSLESIPKSFWDRFSFFSTSISLSKNISITGPLALYHFNRVEGHSIDFGIDFQNLSNKRLSADADLSYGFADKKLKGDFSTTYLLGEYRTHSISFNAFDKTSVLFSGSDRYNRLISTLTSLFGKYDFRDYYRTRGFDVNIEHQTLPVLKLSAGFTNRTDNSLDVNTDFSFLNKDKTYSINQPITNTRLNMVDLGFELDFRKYYEDGYHRRRLLRGSYFLVGGDVTLSSNSVLNSSSNFEIYNMSFYTNVNSISSTYFEILFKGTYSDDALPYQMYTALPGNIRAVSKNNSFRTLRFAEIFGNKVGMIFFNYNFGDEVWRWLNVPLLKDSQINLETYLNSAYVDIDSSELNTPTFKKPFFELGFGITHPLIPLQFEFTWKLNHRNKNNFVFGINTFIF